MIYGNDNYEKIVTYTKEKTHSLFGSDMEFVNEALCFNHMGYFKLIYTYRPLNYTIEIENDRNLFSIDIFDIEGARNSLYRISKYDNELSHGNITYALYLLKRVLADNKFDLYIYRDDKVYKKVTRSSLIMELIRYYKFDIGAGAMRRNGSHVDYLDSKGEWVEDRKLIRKFIGGDTDFEEITEKEVLELINKRKKSK